MAHRRHRDFPDCRACLRLYDLDLVPLHHDEGVNGNFLVRLVRDGAYQYDPAKLSWPNSLLLFSTDSLDHKTLVWYIGARELWPHDVHDQTDTRRSLASARSVSCFCCGGNLGTVATLAAGLMLAVSPGAVYLSRYFIHETLFVFFTLGIVVAGVWFYEEHNPSYLIPAGASAALLFATKETAMISVGVLIIALALTLVYMRFNRKCWFNRSRRIRGVRQDSE